MASLPDDTLRRILVQIQQRAVESKRALQITQQTITPKERERRILQLTIDELKGLDPGVNTYKGVGKMFVMTPRVEMEKELKSQEKELTDDITSLNKKMKFLEKQFVEAQSQLNDIFHNARSNQ
ncbi:Prefoldin [Schizopora paradoxa]|uniref:Prefoldin n=1 Tax=Schizopora paradoxa TaxID=27342 RepID=A0A0H2R5P3_9AGAM|nr:Prefoldin [Schizopora paradoxa]